MPANTVLDWSYWRPSQPQLILMRQLGIVGVQRYETSDSGNQGKVCSKAEYENLLGLGFQVLAGFEVNNTSWRSGYSGGLNHGGQARSKWRLKGHPDSRPIAFAVDSNVAATAADVNLACDYLRGCVDGGGVGPQMVYGESSIITAAYERGIVINGWRAAAKSWDPVRSPYASLEQQVTKSYPQFPPDANGNWPYDENLIIKPDWGQHPAPHTGDDMAIPFTLYKDSSNPQKIWRVDAGGQSKIQVPDLQAVAFCFDQLQQVFGATAADCQVRDATTGEAKRWLDAIPVSKEVVIPPCPPAAVDNAAIAKAVWDVQAAHWANG